MELHPEAPILEAMEVKSVALADLSSREVLKEARKLLLEILNTLDDPSCEGSSAAWSFRLARAHARTLLDQLTRMADSP